jgi:hypothetical protein
MYVHDGFKDVQVDFTPSETNAALASITTQYYDIYEGAPFGHYENLTQINQGNALRNGDAPQSVYGIWSNIGSPYNYFGKTENDQFRVTGAGSVVIGDHSISLGFEYEQRIDRGWTSGTTTGTNGLYGRFAVAVNVLPDATTATAAEYANTTTITNAAPGNAVPQFGGTGLGQGNTWVDTSTNDIWIYA